jgi:hypothetical protein
MSVAFASAAFAKGVLRRLLPQPTVGMIQQTIGMMDYIRSPELGGEWGPFNGQTARQALFIDILAKTRPCAIVETGTSLGATTKLMSQTGLPVFSIELLSSTLWICACAFLAKAEYQIAA